MARTYKRDSRGRFAGGGGGGNSSGRTRPGQNQRGLARASKSAMETRRVRVSGGAWDSPTARKKVDRTNRVAANAQATYSKKGSNNSSGNRSTEARLSRSRAFREAAINRNNAATTANRSRTGKRLEQHRRAVANFMRKLPAAQRRSAAWWADST